MFKQTKMNTNTATAMAFILANPTSDDVRENLGVTPERANEILASIHKGAKEDDFGNSIKGAVWASVASLTNEGERLFGAWAIGHGIGMNDDQAGFEGQENGENPLAALLAAMGTSNNTPDLDTDEDAGN